ncbi:NAD(P)-binding protein [Marasmius fiardii PR-910]|nr:NAD(P)-binding protein [Marasmius fiardii PR-910]
MILTQTRFREDQKREMPPPVEGVSLTGQVVLITGANTGLGYEVANFANRGPAKLIVVCRNERKGHDALNRLVSETGFKNVELWKMNLESFASMAAPQDKIDKLERLDILVEITAGLYMNYKVTEDGWENTLDVNVLGNVLHIILHIPKMIETARKYPEVTPRIVSVSSDNHYWGTVPSEAIDAPNISEFINREDYAQGTPNARVSRLRPFFLLMLIRALQSHLPSSPPIITCCSVNPGLCYSEIRREATGAIAETCRKMEEELARTTEEGSRPILYATIGMRDKEQELRGAYISLNEVKECSDFILSADGQRLEKKLWNEVVEMFGRVNGRAKETIETYLS